MSADITAGAISDRRAATLIGVLFIIGTVSAVVSLVFLPSFATGTDILAETAAHQTATIAGVLLILTMGLALSTIPAVFYPVGRRFSEVLAMGYVIFRGALEGAIYLLTVFIWLVLVALSAEPAAAAPATIALQAGLRVIWQQFIAIPFAIGALMFYWLLFRARLVPRWLSIWGLAGAVLYLIAPLARMAGLEFDLLMYLLAPQEMVLAVWLIAKGFDPGALASGIKPQPLPA